jgi:sulfur relay protein TusB/DsrH
MHIGLILTKTPAEEGFKTFLKFINIYIGKEDISIYLIGNGVYNFRVGHTQSEIIMDMLETSKNVKIYTCLDDVKARGIRINTIIDDVKPFKSYNEMIIDVMENMDQVLTF